MKYEKPQEVELLRDDIISLKKEIWSLKKIMKNICASCSFMKNEGGKHKRKYRNTNGHKGK